MRRSWLAIALAAALVGCAKHSQNSGIKVEWPDNIEMAQWQVVKAGAPDQVVQTITGGSQTASLPPGKYQIAFQPNEYYSGRVIWPETIHVKRGQQAVVPIQSAITIQLPDDIKIWRWQVVKAGQPDEVVQWTTTADRTLLIPPGDYQVTTQQNEYYAGRLVWPDRIQVGNSQNVTVPLRSGISVRLPADAPLWRWQIVSAGNPNEVVQWTTTKDRTLLAPPGDYQVTIQPNEYYAGTVLWPQTVAVQQDQIAAVPLESGITLQLPENTTLWRWQIVDAASPERIVQWTTTKDRTLLVPPGRYQIVTQQNEYYSGAITWPEPIEVAEGQQAEATLHSGIKLTIPQNAKLWRWQIVKAGSPEEVVQWTTTDDRTLLIPPGEYQVVLQAEQYKQEQTVWPKTEPLVVPEGQVVEATPETPGPS